MDIQSEANIDEVLQVEDVPMVHPYPKTQRDYYVRPTYRLTFAKICHLLYESAENIDYISISGTPGIGKSVFYMYAFRKMRDKYPDTTIIMASFAAGDLEEASLFSPHTTEPQSLDLKQLEQADRDHPGALHLYDGAPRKIPKKNNAKMIVFTSPNEKWFNIVRKYQNHCKLYMDVWSLNELNNADRFLKLQIGQAELQERFNTVGGVARHCLTTDRVFRNAIKHIDDAIGKLTSIRELCMCITGVSVHTIVSHRLLHFRPIAGDQSDYEVEFGSSRIKGKLASRFRDVVRTERGGLINTLEFVPKGSPMRGWLFESCVHDQLSVGGEFELKPLSGPVLPKTIVINPNVDQLILEFNYWFDDGTYFIPSKDNNESIDSWYLSSTKKQLILFQATVSTHHSIKARGVWFLLKGKLDMLDLFMQGILEVILVFIVPKGLANSFIEQEITMEPVSILAYLKSLSLTDIAGIGKKKADRLKESGVLTGEQLQNIVDKNSDNEWIESVKKYSVESHELGPVLEKICHIDQFVLGLDTKQNFIYSKLSCLTHHRYGLWLYFILQAFHHYMLHLNPQLKHSAQQNSSRV
ncbi:hypothetical protein MIR68_010485 [Amoeboaphelidium protococcarum]|nr:hypothetical protein MIR68_010485 [Amoeboaphelidium protococcarum]